MAMHDIREYEKKYAVVVFCALHVSRISYGVLKKKYHMLFFPHLYIILYMYVYIPYCGMQKNPNIYLKINHLLRFLYQYILA